MKTFQLIEVVPKKSKKGDPFEILKVRYTETNKEGVVIEMWECELYATRGVTYKPGQNLNPETKFSRNKFGTLVVSQIDMTPAPK